MLEKGKTVIEKPTIVRRTITVPPSGLMTIEQAADYIGCSVSYLEKASDGPAITRIGRRKFYHIDDVTQWLEKRRAA